MKKFYSCSSIAKWAGSPVQYIDGQPYVEKDSMWYYFGEYQDGKHIEYRLVCMSNHDIALKPTL